MNNSFEVNVATLNIDAMRLKARGGAVDNIVPTGVTCEKRRYRFERIESTAGLVVPAAKIIIGTALRELRKALLFSQ